MFLLAWLSAALPAMHAAADDARPPVVTVSMLGTWMLPGAYDVSVAETSLDAGPAAGLALQVDTVLLAPFSIGAQALVLQRDSDDPLLSHSTVSHVGGQVGALFVVHDAVLLGAAALVGLQSVAFSDAEALTQGLGLGLIGHASVRMPHWLWLRAQVGMLWQPTGGQDATDVTMPPTPFFGLGLLLGVPARSG